MSIFSYSPRSHEYDFMVYGDLCALDLIFAEFLARRGARVLVVRKARENESSSLGVPFGFLKALDPSDIVVISSVRGLITQAKRASLVLTFTGAFGIYLRYIWPFRNFLKLPPVINHTTGSDFSELLSEKSLRGVFYRYFVKSVTFNMVVPYPHVLKNIIGLRLKNFSLLRYPYLLPDDKFSDNINLRQHDKERIRYFHPSNIDFGVNDNKPGRTSTKGNDRFICAFLRALDDGLDAECVILDRGPDAACARELVENSRYRDRFIWRSDLSRDDLHAEMLGADILVDQFDVGGLGGIAVEAMAQAKPVMIYIDLPSARLLYPEDPPVINAFSQEQIYSEIMANRDPDRLRQIGISAQEWVYKYHEGESCLGQLVFCAEVALGKPLRGGCIS